MRPEIIIRLFHKIKAGELDLAEAKREALQAKAEERAIQSWITFEKCKSEEDIKKKYGKDIFEDPTFKKEAAKYRSNIRKPIMAGFKAFITNRRVMLSQPKVAGKAAWKTFTTHMVVKTCDSSSSTALESDLVYRSEWKQKVSNYKVFQGNWVVFQLIHRVCYDKYHKRYII